MFNKPVCFCFSSDFSTTVNSVTSCTLVALQWHIARVLLNFCGKYSHLSKPLKQHIQLVLDA